MNSKFNKIFILVNLILCSILIFTNIKNIKLQENNDFNELDLKTSLPNEWTETAFSPNVWRGIDISTSGKHIVASSFTGVWLSSNYGVDWNKIKNSQHHDSAISGSGQYLLCPRVGNQIYVSDDYGQTFWIIGGSAQYYGADMSKDAKYMFTCANNVKIRISDDYGVSWSWIGTSELWFDIACSYDGKYVSATTYGASGCIFVSSDYGISFTSKTSGYDFREIDMSETGQYQIACSLNGYIHTSNDYGNTWSTHSDLSDWYAVAMSSDGSFCLSAKKNGYIYKSNNYGVDWSIDYNEAKDYKSLTMNPEGTIMVASVHLGYIYVKDIRQIIIPTPINFIGSYPLMVFIIIILLFTAMLICYVKIRIFLIMFIILILSLIIGISSMNEFIPFTPFLQVFFLLFQTLIFIITSIEVFKKNHEI